MYEKMMQAAPKTSKAKKSRFVRLSDEQAVRIAGLAHRWPSGKPFGLLDPLADVNRSGTVFAFGALRLSPKIR
jgi:hypothetical protein